MSKLYMVFDVESVGLHGEGFAVGYVVVNEFGVEVTSATISCSPGNAQGTVENRQWVESNVPASMPGIWKLTTREVRKSFWSQWMGWKEKGAVLVADCAWPVEAKFLAQCVADEPSERQWAGPYPLHDLASVLLARGVDPLTKFDRQGRELPEHNPECDARQSARILIRHLHP